MQRNPSPPGGLRPSSKWLVRGLLAFVAAVVAVVLVLAIVPIAFGGRIARWIDRELDAAVGADVTFADLDVGLLTTFPRLTVGLRDLSVANGPPFEGVELVRVARVDLGLDLLAAMRGKVRVRRLALKDPIVSVIVDEQGRTNTDLGGGGASGSGGGGSADVLLDSLVVKNLAFTYDDRQGGTRARVQGLDLEASGRYTGKGARLQTDATLASLTARASGVTWLDAAKVAATVALDWDAKTGALTFGDNTVTVNAMPLAFRGTVTPGERATDLDLAFEVKDTSFKSLLSLVPSAYDDSFANVDAAGTLRLAGTAKGAYVDSDSLPAFDVEVAVADGRFKYPQLPTGVSDIALDLKLHHPGGPQDALVIDVPSLTFRTAGTPARVRAHVEHPVTDPDVRMKAQGVIDLAGLRAALPAVAGSAPPSGRIDADVEIEGRMSDFQAGDASKVKASGTVRATDVRYVAEGWPEMLVRKADLTFSPTVTELRRTEITYGDSDLAVSGSLDGLVPYLLTDTAELSGELQLTSRKLDLRPFSGETEAEPEPGADDAALVAVPTNVDLELGVDIGEFVTDSFAMQGVTGAIVIREGAVRMAPIRGRMLGGDVTLEGTYLAPTAESADVDMQITAVRLDLAETVRTFTTLKRIAPLLEGVVGRFDSGFGVKARLRKDGTPDLSLVSSSGLFAPAGGVLRPKALSSVAGSLGNDAGSIALAGSRVAYAFRDGKIRIDPFTAKLGTIPATISGSAGVLDKTLNLTMAVKVPTAGLAGSPLLASLKKSAGKNVDVQVRVTGTWADPKVTVGLEGDPVLDAIKDVVGGLVDDGLERAQAEADRLLAAARTAADALRAEGKKKADKLVKEAKGNPVKEALAKEAAKQVEKEADKAADKLIEEARKAGDALIAEARQGSAKAIDKGGSPAPAKTGKKAR